MRILALLTIGFAAGCGLLGYQLLQPEGIVLLLVFLLSGGMFLAGRIRKGFAAMSLLLLGLGFGCVWYQAYGSFRLAPAVQLDGKTVEAVIQTTDYSYATDYGRAVDGRITLEDKSFSLRAYLKEGKELEPGTLLQGSFRFRLTTPSAREGATAHSGKGIFLLAYEKSEIMETQGKEKDFFIWSAVLRRQIGQQLESSLPKDVYPFARALLLGDTTKLSYETDTYLKLSGIRHVAAVSGLHVSIVFALAMNLALRKRFLSALTGIPMLVFIAAVAGFTPSVNRACLMSGLMLLALVVKREYDGISALSFSALAMLLWNPLTITNLSFQLSCASVAGIALFTGPVAGRIYERIGRPTGKSVSARAKRWLVSSASTTMGAMVFTTPLCAHSFGTVSLIGVVTNLLTLWVISLVFYGLLAVCILSLIHPSVAVLLGSGTALGIRFVLALAKLLSRVPLGCLYTASDYVVVWLVFVYALLVLCWPRPGKSLKKPIAAAALGLCLALICSWAEPMLYGTSITILDVGQGQCILLQSRGKNILVDCGGSDDASAANIAAQWLLSQGISRLDGIVVTHQDRDHVGGVENLLTQVDTEIMILPPVYSELGLAHPGAIYADRELTLRWEDVTMRIFGEKTWESGNENSLCILLDTEKCDILITGDRNEAGEARLLRKLKNQKADILVVGHHGSKTATSEALLSAVEPEIACISVGADNSYGHPAPQTLNRLYRHGCRVYRTDLHGTITIRR